MPDPVQPREGDIAFAVSVGTLYDLTIGQIGWDVRLTRHSSPDKFTLTLSNRTPGGPILNIVPTLADGSLDLAHPIFQISGQGVHSQTVGGWVDFRHQPGGTPSSPGAGSNILRMYARGGQLFFKAEDSAEQQIPVGQPPGPSMRWAFWMGGG